MSIAKHYQTGETLPEEVYKKLLAARTFRAGSFSLRQVEWFIYSLPVFLLCRMDIHRIKDIPVVCVCLNNGFDVSFFQLKFASIDLELHTTYIPGGPESIYDVDKRISVKTQVIPPLSEDRFLCGFSHIFSGKNPLKPSQIYSSSSVLI